MTKQVYIGLMSGTSLDGIDIAAVDFSDNTANIIAASTTAYSGALSNELKQAISLASANTFTLEQSAELDNKLGEAYGEAINLFLNKHNLNASDIIAIGSHGHTLLHKPNTTDEAGYSIQIGNPNNIAAITSIKVVADFRRADIALGGQGAPLAPAFHAAFLSSNNEKRIVVNIGGIANITLLDKADVVTGFDTGPGNTLMDTHCQKYLGMPYDSHGDLASQGTVDLEFCEAVLKDAYFLKAIPKSTGREYFTLDWFKQYLDKLGKLENQQFSHEDILANLCYITAKSIADACLEHQEDTDVLLVCGGGVHNKTLMNMLKDLLPYKVKSSQDYGIDPNNVEAAAFAWLAQQRLLNKPSNLPQVTGAERLCLLGSIYEL